MCEVETKICSKCGIEKSISEFNKDTRPARNLTHDSSCRVCKKEQKKLTARLHRATDLARGSRRRAYKLKASPKWADSKKILEVYKQRESITKETGVMHHVDHIVPLQGKYVCGLHVDNNLRIIPALENIVKSNKFIEDIVYNVQTTQIS